MTDAERIRAIVDQLPNAEGLITGEWADQCHPDCPDCHGPPTDDEPEPEPTFDPIARLDGTPWLPPRPQDTP